MCQRVSRSEAGNKKAWGGKWSDRYAFKSLSKSDYTQWVIWVPEIASVGEVCFWSFPHPTVVLHFGAIKEGRNRGGGKLPHPKGEPGALGSLTGPFPAWRVGLGFPYVPHGLLELSPLVQFQWVTFSFLQFGLFAPVSLQKIREKGESFLGTPWF